MKNEIHIVFLTMGNRSELLHKIETLTSIIEKTNLHVTLVVSYNSHQIPIKNSKVLNQLNKDIKVVVTPEYFDSAEEHLYYVYEKFSKNAIGKWLWVLSDEDPFVKTNLLEFLSGLSKLPGNMVFLGTRWEGDAGWRSPISSYSPAINQISVREKLLHVGIPYAGSKIGSFIFFVEDNFFESLVFFKESFEISTLFTHGFFHFHLSCSDSTNSHVWPKDISVNAPNPTDTDRSQTWLDWYARHDKPFQYDWIIGQLKILEKLHASHLITSEEILYSTISDIQRGNLSYVWDLCWRINNKLIPALLHKDERFPKQELSESLKFLERIGFDNQKLLNAWRNTLTNQEISTRERLTSLKFAKFSWNLISQDPLYFLRYEPYLNYRIVRIRNKFIAFKNSSDAKTVVRFFYSLENHHNLFISQSIESLHARILEEGDFKEMQEETKEFENVRFEPILWTPRLQILFFKFAPRISIALLSRLVKKFGRS